ncbi:MAG: mevalonate kinase [Chloroflexi bacterium]|nr:MAG: mevalonate kinase [Chloroflexota bacterium]PIE80447.1 MAG: mevalonate kinase [Chloroflexota bacterium]
MTTATAPGKIILFGEHAVVYGQPAIAAPLSQVQATAVIQNSATPGIRLIAPDLDSNILLSDADTDDAIAAIIYQLQAAAQLDKLPDLTVTVSSQIPIASGLGSGAAITAAIIRALATHLGLAHLLTDEWVSDQTYEIEKIHHGTPSGIDNTVVAYERPIYFVRQQPRSRIEPFAVAQPLRLLIADTGIRSSTKDVVGDVRRQWQAEEATFNAMFEACGHIANTARHAIEQGNITQIGQLMTENHAILQTMTVSNAKLDELVAAALAAGALGAKLSGAGRGGNMIALVEEAQETAVYQALLSAQAKNILTTTIQPT